jgi:hypothetical protein
MTRSIHRENAHRKGIYREAINLVLNGWHVLANHIPGYSLPPEIEGYIPDIYAIKSSETLILEITTSEGINSEKLMALKAYSSSFREIEFSCWMVDSAGCRIMRIEEPIINRYNSHVRPKTIF